MTGELNEATAYDLYRRMALIRAFEERVYELYMMGRIVGPVHSCAGQEAIPVGVSAVLQPGDLVSSYHRGHGHAIAKGVPIENIMAEIFGRVDGCCRGKGGSMHITDLSVGFLGGNGVVGASLPIATGAALSAAYRGTKQVVIAYFGDGAAQEGATHEALNLAAVWQLPIVFVCENNLYATTVHISKATRVRDIAPRAAGYGLPWKIVDGMRIADVVAAAGEAVKRARSEGGPTLIECKVYRFMGHSRTDPGIGVYRAETEVEEWKRRDPLLQIVSDFSLDPKRAADIRQEGESHVADAVSFAEKSALPTVDDAHSDVVAMIGTP